MHQLTPGKKILAACGLILVALLLVTPAAARVLSDSVFTTKVNTGVHEFMKNYGYGASGIDEMEPCFTALRSLDMAPSPTPEDHPVPVPMASVYGRVPSIFDFITISGTNTAG